MWGPWGPMMGGPWSEGAWWMMALMGVINVVFWGAIVALGVWALRRVTQPARAERPSPEEIARERYARGEITREQFEEIRTTLASGASGG